MEKDPNSLAQWQEPEVQPTSLSGKKGLYLIAGFVVVAIILIAVAIWQHDATFYLAIGVLVAAGISLLVQKKRPSGSLPITLYRDGLQVGQKFFPLAELAGFWLQNEAEYVVINIESKKRSLLPITFLFPTGNTAEAREMFLNLLPEIEGRTPDITDTITRWFHL